MKRFALSIAFLAAVSIAAGAGFHSAREKKKSRIVGRWEMVSGEFGGQKTINPDSVSIKVISANHFMYLEYDKKTSKLVGTGCGSYTYDGGVYSEHVEFSERPESPEAKQLIGTTVTFHVTVEGDTLTQTGQLLGHELKEVYKRAD